MKIAYFLFAAALCFVLSSCHRPTALFQPTSRPAAARLSGIPIPIQKNAIPESTVDSVTAFRAETDAPIVVSRQVVPAAFTEQRRENRVQHMRAMLSVSARTDVAQPEPKQPKPKKQLRLGNRIRQGLGIPLRKELNWWQRISWKMKAAVPIILLAVVFAILGITILAIIFGVLGAFLLISGLKRSFKVRRPWF